MTSQVITQDKEAVNTDHFLKIRPVEEVDLSEYFVDDEVVKAYNSGKNTGKFQGSSVCLSRHGVVRYDTQGNRAFKVKKLTELITQDVVRFVKGGKIKRAVGHAYIFEYKDIEAGGGKVMDCIVISLAIRSDLPIEELKKIQHG